MIPSAPSCRRFKLGSAWSKWKLILRKKINVRNCCGLEEEKPVELFNEMKEPRKVMFHPHTQKQRQVAYYSFGSSLDELLGFEETPQIENLPSSKSEKTTHSEYAEEQDSVVCWFWNWDLLEYLRRSPGKSSLPFVSLISSSRFLIKAKSWTMASDKSSSFLSSNSSGLSLAASAI